MSQNIIYISSVLHLVYSTAVCLLSYIALSLELSWPTSAKSLLLDCRKPENKFENAPCSSWYLEQCIFRCILPSHGVQNDQISPYLNWKHWSSCITKHLLDKVEHSCASTLLYSPGVGALFEPENMLNGSYHVRLLPDKALQRARSPFTKNVRYICFVLHICMGSEQHLPFYK